jgi:hypothetical protein
MERYIKAIHSKSRFNTAKRGGLAAKERETSDK